MNNRSGISAFQDWNVNGLAAAWPQYLKVEEVATMLRIRPSTVYQMVHKKRIPFRKAGRQLLFDPQEIDAWTKNSAVDGDRD